MPYLHLNGNLVFTSAREVVIYYTNLIDELIPRLQGLMVDEYKAIQAEIDDLRQQLVDHLKDFGHSRVDEYFNTTMATAESDQELYDLSNAYEDLLTAELTGIKEKLRALRVS